MNFQPTDYLADLNLEFEGANMSPVEEVNKADLDLFVETEFFDLDVFSHDLPPQTKEVKQPQQQHQQIQPQPQPSQNEQVLASLVKKEMQDHVRKDSFDSELDNVDFVDISIPNDKATALELSMRTTDMSPEELSEIKRKRNTAASARFRIKKKMKEKQMEQQASELRERLTVLEKKLKTLEMENKCLKQLLIEKNEKKNSDLLDNIKKRSLGEGKTSI